MSLVAVVVGGCWHDFHWQVGAVNQQSFFYVLIRDAFDNPRTVNDVPASAFAVTINGVAQTIPAPVYSGNDAYKVMFTPTVTGVLTMAVTVNGVGIVGSPFHPTVL